MMKRIRVLICMCVVGLLCSCATSHGVRCDLKLTPINGTSEVRVSKEAP
jgi:hypothetical protein